MFNEIEIEFKNSLSEEEFKYICLQLNISENDFISQINYYFDTPDFELGRNKSALRIREKSGNYTLTLKQQKNKSVAESHLSIDKKEAETLINNTSRIPDEMRELLLSINISIDGLTCFGKLETARAKLPYANGFLFLDKSKYLNIVDFEVEYEVYDYEVGCQDFEDFLEKFEIPFRKTPTKIQRFFEALNTNQ
ncbi:MAG: Adenylate cyclase [Bacillales bacterium]|nr:Adenylate cyclase [Bacillales bacterium]